MDQDQLAEYRKRHQSRYTEKDAAADEALAKKLQEEEQSRWQKATAKDEEIAKKLQEQTDYPVSDYTQPTPAQNPYNQHPAYVPYPTNPNPPQHYQTYPAHPPRLANTNQAQQPLLSSNQQAGSCLPEVNDKCLGVNTQHCVLGTAAAMVVGIIVLIIMISL